MNKIKKFLKEFFTKNFELKILAVFIAAITVFFINL